jgi:filamentous hemagglutinin
VKEAIRELLHSSLNRPLTRSMAQNAYKKAITLVVTDAWHKADSRTYGGRNSKSQILQDAQDLVTAAMEEWKKTVQGLRDDGLSDQEIEDVWDALGKARDEFFATGNANKGTL